MVAGFATGESLAADNKVPALRMIGGSSLPDPMTMTFALGTAPAEGWHQCHASAGRNPKCPC